VKREPRFRRRRRIVGGALVAAVVAVAVLVVVVVSFRSPAPSPQGLPCRATAGATTVELDLDQAQNAATIAAVGRRDGLPDHAVTVALATAMQESKLRNLDYGDRDSLGIFQQRPSQGWGTAEQVMSPEHSAGAFYAKLTAVPGWQTMEVTDAAQRVQRSGAPAAYARWGDDARALAQALTGEVPAGLACRVVLAKGSTPAPGWSDALAAELGPGSTDASAAPAQGWAAASWLVGHAAGYQLKTVSYAGQRWTAKSGEWRTFTGPGANDGGVQVT
jgi:hypothetical protein